MWGMVTAQANSHPEPKTPDNFLAGFFRLASLDTNIQTEVLAGITTFLTMSYIIFVNPSFLSFTGEPHLAARGLPFEASVTATCLAAGVCCLLMGLFTNYPFALAPGMGLNAIVAYQLVASLGLSWAEAMGVIVAEGLLITGLVLTGLREKVMQAIPLALKKAISVGIGLFIAFIGLVQAGIVQKSSTTLVTLGDLRQPPVLVAIIGLLFTALLIRRKIKGGLFFGIIFSTAVAIIWNFFTDGRAFSTPQVAVLPQALMAIPEFGTIGHFSFGFFAKLGFFTALLVVFSIMLSDFFDTLGTVVGLGSEAGFLDSEGRLPRIKKVLLVDSCAAWIGGICNASSVTTYIESASGISTGGRSGLTPVVTALLFFFSVFFSPLVGVVPKEATAPALIIVGFLMLSIIREIPFDEFDLALPAFITMLVIPLTYSISNGIGIGFIAFTFLKLFSGRPKEVHWLMYIVASAFLLDFALKAV